MKPRSSPPPAYPAPVTSAEQRRINRKLREELRATGSPLVESRHPLDGIVGVLLIAFLVGGPLVLDYDLATSDTVERPTALFYVYVAAGHIGSWAFAGWAILTRRSHRRMRRLAMGQCLACGHSLLNFDGDRCPKCGALRAAT